MYMCIIAGLTKICKHFNRNTISVELHSMETVEETVSDDSLIEVKVENYIFQVKYKLLVCELILIRCWVIESLTISHNVAATINDL